MEVSKKARRGLDWAVKTVDMCFAHNKSPKQTLDAIGLEEWEEIFWFFQWLQHIKREDLIKKLSA